MAEEAENTEEKPVKKSKKIILIVIISALLFLLIIGGLIIALALSGDESVPMDAGGNVTAQQTSERAPRERSNDFFNLGPMYPMDQFVVNLLSEQGGRFLKMELNLELSEEKLTAEIDQKKPLIRDIIIRSLSSKTYEDISTQKGKEHLKDEIVTKINETLRDGYVKNVFFTDFIIQ